MSLTSAQRRILEAAARHKGGRVVGGDPRTRAILIDRKFIERDGSSLTDRSIRYVGPGRSTYYGPLFKITDAGQQAVRPKE